MAPSLAKDEFTDVAVSYVASICCTLMDLKQTSDEAWTGVGELLALLVKDLPADANATLKAKCADMMVAEPEHDDDEDAEELCNCQFTLAYGEDKELGRMGIYASCMDILISVHYRANGFVSTPALCIRSFTYLSAPTCRSRP